MMKRGINSICVIVVCVILLIGCGSNKIAVSDVNFEGVPYPEVVSNLEEDGFSNIITMALYDLPSAEADNVDLVAMITVDDELVLDSETTYSPDAEVIIYYHSIKYAYAPFSSDELPEDDSYESIINEFELAGFTNIKTEIIEDLVFGWLTEDGEVEEILIDGKEEFEVLAEYPCDVEVIVKYHTFPEENEDKEEKHIDEEVTDVDEEETEAILTADNNTELAAVLVTKNEFDSIIKSFAEKYDGEIIEFDGNVRAFSNHGSYDTRYDILLAAGDYDENSQSGPNFQFVDVGPYDLGIGTFDFNDYIAVGKNLKIKAEVEEFDENSGLFKLDPISIEVR